MDRSISSPEPGLSEMIGSGFFPAVLFARRDSVYKTIPHLDVYDEERDARNFDFHRSVIAHPPCRGWGRLRKFAKVSPHELDLAHFAVRAVRECGGVLEHPEYSSLWDAAGLPRPGTGRDAYGGWSISIDQFWFGHRARKATWLYIVGAGPQEIPPFSIRLDLVTHVIAGSSRHARRGLKHCTKAEREHTPEPFAQWLVDLAKSCKR